MIVGIFIQILSVSILFILSLLPVSAFPTAVTNAVLLFWSYVNLFSMVIPVGTLLTVLLLAFGYLAAKYGWLFFHWVLRRFKH